MRSSVKHYALAVAAVAVAAMSKELVDGGVGRGTPLVFFVPAVTVAAWAGGQGAGFLATILSTLICCDAYFPPIGSFRVSNRSDLFLLLLFWLQGTMTSLLMEQLHSSRRQAEESVERDETPRDQLARSEGLLRDLLDRSMDLISIRDLEGRYLAVNRSHAELYGGPDGTAVGLTDLDLYPSDLAETRRSDDRLVIEHGRALGFEYVIPLADGPHIFSTVKFPLRGPAGVCYGVGCFATDITRRKDAEARLHKSEEEFRALADAIPQLVWMANEYGQIFWYNKNWYEYTGTTAAELEGLGWRSVHDLGVLPAVMDGWGRSIAAGKPFEIVFSLRGVDGTFRPFLTRVNPVRGPDGRVARWFGTNTDITERARAEAALRESEERLRLALVAARMGTLHWDVPGGRITWSGEHQGVWGYTLEECGDTYEAFSRRVLPEDRGGRDTEVARCIAAREPFTHEYRVRWPDATLHWVQESGEFTFDESGRAVRMLGVVMEVTERKQAEATLRESEKRFRALVEQAADGILICDARGAFQEFNSSGCEMLGYTRGELLRLNAADIVPPDELPRVAPELEEVLTTGQPYLREWSIRRKNGTKFPGEVNARLLPDGRVLAILRDITERRRAEAALRERTEQLELAIQVARVGVWRWDVQADVVRTIQEFGPLSGLLDALHPPTSAAFRALVHPDDQPRVTEHLRRVVEEGGAYQVEFRIVLPDHSVRWVSEKGNATRDDAGQTAVLVGVDLDITEQRQAEAERDRLFNLSLDMMSIVGFDGFFRQVNPAWSKTLGWSEAELLASPWDVIVHPGDRDRMAQTFARLMAGEPVLGFENRYRCADGSYRWVSWSSFAVPAEGAAFCVARDITGQKQTEEALRRATEELEDRVAERTVELEAANKELEAFSYSVSHDLRAPLRAIAGFSRIIVEDFGSALSEEPLGYLHDVCTNARRMGRLLDDLLAFSRLGRHSIQKSTVAVNPLVQQCIEELGAGSEEGRVEFRVANLPPCLASLPLLKQVWMNLLGNALKYSRKRDPAVIEVGARIDPAETVYFVKDNGVGFDMRYSDKLFGVFQRLHRQEDYEGTGVGLAIVQRVIHRHGGRAWAESELGHGATFSFSLPVNEGIRQ